MRRMFLLLALLSLCYTHALKAQITDVYAGNDTIELRVGNYQYGFIQWQTSQDTIQWENIEGATEPVYRFLPTENAYYRALAFFDNCPDVTSRVCYVQVPPKADAGPDRKLMEGSGATMFAVMGDDCVGRWEIIEGANGMLDDPNSPNAYFEGSDVEYKLKWTVTNACGSASDTITIQYNHTVWNENYIVVDTTDVVFSDSTQLVNGEYLISFSEPVTLNDSMLLCGVGAHGFLRKIISYTYDSELDVYDIETEQAAVSDFLIDGVLSYDLKAMMRRGKVVFSHRYPTRKDIAELGFDYLYFRLPDSSDSTTMWTLGQKGWSVSWKPGPVSLPGYISINPDFDLGTPNVIFEIEKDFPKVTYLKVGVQVDYHLSLRFGLPSASGVTIYKDKMSVMPRPIQIPLPSLGFVTVDFEFDVLASLNASLTLDSEMTFELSKDGTLTHYIVFDPTAPEEWTKHYGVDTHPMQFEVLTKPMEYADLSVKASLGPQLSFLFGKIVRLYAEVDVVAEEKFCIFGEGFNSGEFRLGLDFVGGLKAKIWKKLLFDLKYSKTLCNFIDYKDPASIHYFSGNQQVFNPDNHLPEPIAVQLRNSRGKPSSGTRVKFETDDGYFSNDKPFTNGNGVAYTNWICGNNPTGVVTARATAFNYKHEPIENAPVHFKAFHGNSSIPDCFNTTLAVTADVSSGYLRPKATGGQGSYLYSTDGLVFSPTWTPIVPVGGQTYHLYVKDAFDCVAECYYTHPTFACFSSNLQLRVEQYGNTVTAYATGGAGGGGGSWKDLAATDNAVYEFSIDDGAFSPNNVFQNLIDGRHVVYVRDANGCEESNVFTVETNGSGIGTGGGDDDGVTVTTSAVNVVDNTSATCGGSVSITGNAFVTQYGICWSTHHAPTTSDQYVQKAYNGNTFSNCLMTNLSSTEVYYVRAFAVTNTGTVYGNEVGFCLTTSFPQVATANVANITTNSARVGGNVTVVDSSPVTERGVCWSTGHNPTAGGLHLACGSGTGVFTANLTNLIAGMRYYVCAYATNVQGTAYGNEVEFITENGGGGVTHEYVDLGLPSGTLWATCNVGANVPEEYGDYFAWGETHPKEIYDWNTYQHCMGSDHTLTKYCYDSGYGYNGYTDDLTIIQPEDDAASVNWGGGWHIPSEDEWRELFQSTTHVWTIQNGVYGCHFAALNGNTLFLPAAGYRRHDEIVDNCKGNYWSCSLYVKHWPEYAWEFCFDSLSVGNHRMFYTGRHYGRSIRCVCATSSSSNLPQVVTSEVDVFTSSTAICRGDVVTDSGATVTVRGVCWSTLHNPTLNNNHANSGAGLGVFTVNISGLSPATTYYVRSYATNASGTSYGNEVSFTTLDGGDTHEYVDLGLPSGILWATCNIGANAPEEYGGYFAWGETQTKSVYNWNTYKYCNGSFNTLIKYCTNSNYGYNGFADGQSILLPEDDAAIANWGEDWHVPTEEEWEELFENTTNTLTTINGVDGRLFTALNGNSLFLPLAGSSDNSGYGGWGEYLSNALDSGRPFCSMIFYFDSGAGIGMSGGADRFEGYSVRPVCSARQK